MFVANTRALFNSCERDKHCNLTRNGPMSLCAEVRPASLLALHLNIIAIQRNQRQSNSCTFKQRTTHVDSKLIRKISPPHQHQQQQRPHRIMEHVKECALGASDVTQSYLSLLSRRSCCSSSCGNSWGSLQVASPRRVDWR